MSDKKTCQNCAIGLADLPFKCKTKSKCHNLAKWERPSYLWLSILPTEPGWYWWRSAMQREPAPIKLVIPSGENELVDFDSGAFTEEWGGQWQGPIAPNNEEG